MRILAISGSLRDGSTNTSLLRALTFLTPPGVEMVLYEELSLLPPFNPDHEGTNEAEPVARFREFLQRSSVVFFSTPEYAHGIPGVLKNALDWVVGSGELSEKPVILMNASSRAIYAQASLREVLATMNAKLLPEAEVTIDVPRGAASADIVANSIFRSTLEESLRVILQAVQ